jgi:hypothetical protein
MGFVDVIYHVSSPLPQLNYVTPRRNTAWVSANYLSEGLKALGEKGRNARVRFAEGLYPPIFIRTLTDLGLVIERETPIMAYRPNNPPETHLNLPAEVTYIQAEDHISMSIWWYVWKNAWYEVLVSGVEPLLIARDLSNIHFKEQINIILYRNRYPIGVSRITLHEGSAHLMAQAILREMRTPEMERTLRQLSLHAALRMGCDLVFASGDTAQERTYYRDLGFVDAGSMVTYAEPQSIRPASSGENDGTMEQSVLVV